MKNETLTEDVKNDLEDFILDLHLTLKKNIVKRKI